MPKACGLFLEVGPDALHYCLGVALAEPRVAQIGGIFFVGEIGHFYQNFGAGFALADDGGDEILAIAVDDIPDGAVGMNEDLGLPERLHQRFAKKA